MVQGCGVKPKSWELRTNLKLSKDPHNKISWACIRNHTVQRPWVSLDPLGKARCGQAEGTTLRGSPDPELATN